MTTLCGTIKKVLRMEMKDKILPAITPESRKKQSYAITERVIGTDDFKKAQTISIYLSTSTEVDTTNLLTEMFQQGKKVFVPTYNKNVMEMVKLDSMLDYESLPLTKWNIKQPNISDGRENALTCGGIDLFIVPGVAFSRKGGRLGHGMGFYDKYFKRHSETYPDKKSILMAIAFKEQIVPVTELPLAEHDVILDYVVTQDDVFSSK
ncbi:5-formyltetrahydrofolate cyclo-ligase [Episyrphus balteatus]|uniref:5-formyltetrahydrofolate cyclo-ligase n=1 Tax=Episyrphus balteatus TaxID=286459 RepID=UPI002485195D|nr:5-formyltetrahydrofolate cyclo-ligase [Episyrphus balteatus]